MPPLNPVEQIIEWKHRRGQHSVSSKALWQMESLQRLWNTEKRELIELSDYMPMRMVTLTEVFVRELVREVVDFGSPYLDRAANISRHAKFDFVFAMNLHGKQVTIGDLVSHSVSINDMTSITSIFTTLLDKPLKENLAKSTDRWKAKMEGETRPIIADIEAVYCDMERLFKLRHILTHELPEKRPYETDAIDVLFDSCSKFLTALELYIAFELRGDVPLTQSDINARAGDLLREAEAELEDLLTKISVRGINASLLAKAQAAWEVFVEKESDLHGDLVAGGSMQPFVWSSTKESLVRDRIKQLSWWLEREDDNAIR